ncbi:MAG: VWA domain-containing protein [Magnetococcales bacterium]|nr:VWA domain-containing protein [Magnetococcales bacterium]
MNDLQFARPDWIILLWGVAALIVGLWMLDRRAQNILPRFVAVALQKNLVRGTGPLHRWLHLTFLSLAFLCLTLALMRPQWGVHWITPPRSGANLMICLDVSKSMLAEDVAPNRLERAKAELRDLLSYLRGNQLGLIVFSGRATVLSPLTPDFGFFRLALDQAGPHSVPRGGTRLEEPIRKAIDGLGSGGDVSRSILLITDGEDQDSFPLEAAKEAAKRGIRILAIGFGDEQGSELQITNPKTGVRSVVRDANGNVVKSRLDGALLRQIALITEGAYIPAGVGVLDLKSIYERHIAPLTRGGSDGTRRTIQNDAFQWAVLMGLIFLLAALISTSGRSAITGLMCVALMGALLAPNAMAAEEPATKSDTAATAATPTNPATHTPREEFNLGVEQLERQEFDAALTLLSTARDRAGTDGELRFRATYNLGWAEAGRAGTRIKDKPEEALQGFNRAAAWLREAIALRPNHEESRHNLEVVLGRAMALADTLAAAGKGDLATHLDALIQAQRDLIAAMTPVATQQAAMATPAQPLAVEPGLRQQFRDLSARQLEVIAQGEELGAMAGLELEQLRQKKEPTPQERMRLHQLELLQEDLHEARERMGQGRGALRGFQGVQAFGKGNVALSRLKQARERLAELPARLDALLADATQLAQLTALPPAPEATGDAPPPWLTVEWLQEMQGVIKDRTEALRQGIEAGLPPEARGSQPGSPTPGKPGEAASEGTAPLEEAHPLVADAVTRFGQAGTALQGGDRVQALNHQEQALAGLTRARELFLALKGLLDLAWRDEQQIKERLQPDPPPTDERIATAWALQETNLARMRRVGDKIAAAKKSAQQAGSAPPAEDQATTKERPTGEEERQRLERAGELQALTVEKMDLARQDLLAAKEKSTSADSGSKDLGSARVRIDTVLGILEELRQLFFSVVEHLRQTAARQQDLVDDTQKLEPLTTRPDETSLTQAAGPVMERQTGLARTTRAIRDALAQQVETMKKNTPSPDAAKTSEDATSGKEAGKEAGKELQNFEKVITHVEHAREAMDGAAQKLKDPKKELTGIKELQHRALTALHEALALLSPPPEAEPKPQQDANGDSGKEQSGTEGQSPQAAAQEKPSDIAGSRMLQGIRDREALRRRQRDARGTMNYEPVEKDW